MFEESIYLREVGGIVGRETGCVKGADEKFPRSLAVIGGDYGYRYQFSLPGPCARASQWRF